MKYLLIFLSSVILFWCGNLEKKIINLNDHLFVFESDVRGVGGVQLLEIYSEGYFFDTVHLDVSSGILNPICIIVEHKIVELIFPDNFGYIDERGIQNFAILINKYPNKNFPNNCISTHSYTSKLQRINHQCTTSAMSHSFNYIQTIQFAERRKAPGRFR